MDYAYTASGAQDTEMARALIRYFDYDSSVSVLRLTNGGGISASDWKDIVIGQMENNSPVYYSGFDAGRGVGHAFVIDGYDAAADRFHINWGGGGDYDGFFALTALNPNTYQFSQNISMITNIMPNQGGNPPVRITVSRFDVSTTPAGISANVMAKVRYGADFSGKIGVAVVSDGAAGKVLDSADYFFGAINSEDAGLRKQFGNDVEMLAYSGAVITLQPVIKRGAGAWTPIGETRQISVPTLYAITYDLNGGSASANPAVYSAETPDFTLVYPFRAGYTFTGWTGTNGADPQAIVTIAQGSSGDRKYTANWALGRYTITFDATGGTVIPESGVTGEDCTLDSLPTPTRAGYIFEYWHGVNTGEAGLPPPVYVTVLMRDSHDNYGDGWNGAELRIVANGRDFATGARLLSGGVGTNMFGFTNGSVVELYWVKGAADSECAFALYYDRYLQPPPFNPESGAANDTSKILLSRQYGDLSGVADGALLGSFTVPGTALNIVTASTAFSGNTTIYARWREAGASVLSNDRVTPQVKPNEEVTVIAPANRLTGEFAAGPNPAEKSSGTVKLFRQGKWIRSGTLTVYDATGNVVNRVKINDRALGSQARRQVGAWDLTDSKGRQVSEGTYLVKGVIKASDGKAEKVSVIVGVR